MGALLSTILGGVGDIFGMFGANSAGQALAKAGNTAANNVTGAATQGQRDIYNALSHANDMTGSAQQYATDQVNTATQNANGTLNSIMGGVENSAAPFMAAGTQGVGQLQQYAANAPQFNFSLNDYLNSPAMKFQMDQGTQAINNSMAASGLGSSGAALKELTQYGQGLASTYYQQAFNNAQSQFQTNQSATMQDLSSLINAGEFGTSQFNSGIQNLGSQMAQNTSQAGYYAGNTQMSVAQLLSQLGLQGAEASGQLGLTGATNAGNFLMQGAGGKASGMLGLGNNFASLAGTIGNFFNNRSSGKNNNGSIDDDNTLDVSLDG